MIVRQPTASEDRPAIAISTIVGGIALGLGLWLAHAAMGHPAPQALDESESETRSESGSASESEPIAAVAIVVDEPPPSSVVAASPPPEPPAARASTPSSTPASPRTITIGTGAATHVRHGRIAYLRCDGAPQAAGPFPCPRDTALEAAVAAAIDQLTACTPPLPPGNADLVLEWDRETSPSVAITTRDTFPDDAIRTDGPGVLACITPTLAALTTTIPGDRTRVGFRFELVR